MSTFSAVVRSSSDRRAVLAKSTDWNTKRDAEILGVAELERGGWTRLSVGVLCIDEERDAITNHPQDPAEVILAHALAEGE